MYFCKLAFEISISFHSFSTVMYITLHNVMLRTIILNDFCGTSLIFNLISTLYLDKDENEAVRD